MKGIYKSKAFWMLSSLVLSFVLWIYVTSVESDEIRQTFRGVRVELVGESVLRNSRNLAVHSQIGVFTSFILLFCSCPYSSQMLQKNCKQFFPHRLRTYLLTIFNLANS